MQAEGRLLDVASRMELRMLERELERLQDHGGVVTLVSRTGFDERREIQRSSHDLCARSAATRVTSRQLRKQIIRQNLIEGDGPQFA